MSARSCANCCARAASLPADIAAIGVTGMLPAVVLLDAAGRLLRPSIQQSDARCGAEVDELRAEIDEKAFLAKAGNGINQQLVAGKLRWIERHEPEIFARIATVFGSYDYINWRLTGERAIEQNWALEAGFVDLATHAIDDALVALAHIPRAALPRKVASHEILGAVSDRGAAESGLGRDAGHRRRGRPYRLGARRGHRQRRRRAAEIRRLGRHSDRDRSGAPRPAPVPRLPSEARPLRAQRMHVDRRLRAQLVRAPVRLAAKRRPPSKPAFRSINGSTGSPRRGPPAATGSSSRPIFSAKRRRSTTPTRARRSTASRFRTTSAISGARCSRPTPTRSRTMSR